MMSSSYVWLRHAHRVYRISAKYDKQNIVNKTSEALVWLIHMSVQYVLDTMPKIVVVYNPSIIVDKI